MFKQLLNLYFSPPDTSGGTVVEELNKEDMIDFLKEDEDEKEVLPLGKDKTIPSDKSKSKEDESSIEEDETEIEEEDELKEIEQELEGPTEEQLELVPPVRRQEILKAYPDLFKKFPYLEKAYYREQQFTEILPTIQDAKEAVDKAQTLDKFERDLVDGNTEKMLKAVKYESPEAFNRIVDNYMTTLASVDKDAHMHVVGNTIKHTIMAMVKESRASDNEALQTAAQILNQFVFGSSDFSPPSQLSKGKTEDNSRDIEFQKKEQAFINKQFDSSRNDLNTRINTTLKNTIDVNIDPKNSMSDYVKRNASREALESLESYIEKDTRFKSLLDRLWEVAFKKNFSKESTDNIKSAYLSKAKTLLPSVIKKARNEALRGIGKHVVDSEEEKSDKSPISSGRPRSTSTGKITKASEIPRDMKTLDYLNSD